MGHLHSYALSPRIFSIGQVKNLGIQESNSMYIYSVYMYNICIFYTRVFNRHSERFSRYFWCFWYNKWSQFQIFLDMPRHFHGFSFFFPGCFWFSSRDFPQRNPAFLTCFAEKPRTWDPCGGRAQLTGSMICNYH